MLAHEKQTLIFYMGMHGSKIICEELIKHGLSDVTPAALIVKGTTESGDTQTLVEFADTTKSTMENDTYVTLGLVATKGTNLDKVEFYINRNKVGQSTTNIPTANMKVMAMSVSGDATGQKITTIDYIMAAQDRNVSYS